MIDQPRDIRYSRAMEQAIRRAVEVAAASGYIHMGWTVVAAAAPAGGKTGRDSRHKTAVDDAFLCRP
jgi:hypothetical protein